MDFHEKKEFRFFKMIPWIVLGIVGAAALALLFGLILMLLWNWIMPEIFGLPEVTYWQAWGLVLLAHILFKGPMGGHQDSHHREDDRHREYWQRKFRDKFENPSNHRSGFHRSAYREQAATGRDDNTAEEGSTVEADTTEDDNPTKQQASNQWDAKPREDKNEPSA